ncbi:MAG: hypothetical protein ACON35_06990 [Candidatus Marinamargulisbacteria bacterium]
MKILLLSCHLYQSKNQAGFHHYANAFQKLNHNVSFCTCPNSLLNLLKELKTDPSRFFERVKVLWFSFFPTRKKGIRVSGYFSLLHNYANLNYGQSIFKLIFLLGYSRIFNSSENYDIIIFESNICLYLHKKLKKQFPSATFIYRISDVLKLIGGSDDLIAHEKTIIHDFDLLVVPTKATYAAFKALAPSSKILLQQQGVNKHQFEHAMQSPSPYDKSFKHAAYVGMSEIDWEFIQIAANLFPNIQFHIIGPYSKKISSSNIFYHGLLPFQDSLPYIAHCDLGLNIARYPNETPSSFIPANKPLKYMQYTYFKKPIITPSYLQLNEPHVFNYDSNENSIKRAIEDALAGSFTIHEKIFDWLDHSREIIAQTSTDLTHPNTH